MSDFGRSLNVLKKILQTGDVPHETTKDSDKLVQEFFQPRPTTNQKKNNKGRPPKEEKFKARNLTLCLAPEYIHFIDQMKAQGPKLKGRGRKIRWIIDQFMEMQERQKSQLQVLGEALTHVEEVLKSFSSQVRKGMKLELTQKEKNEISKKVKQALIMMKILGYNPKTLQKLLPHQEWAIVSFCLNWSKRGA